MLLNKLLNLIQFILSDIGMILVLMASIDLLNTYEKSIFPEAMEDIIVRGIIFAFRRL